ncbi:hypothetical protein HRR83_009490 [Exophiala dermatitidis]|uniref:Dynein light intermediate chain 1, cytosolic n=1 Tax=Exophiala dermatitidis TaxID=5970 RepID=A0AAN6IQN5_EXODE|nr:hypothetical protein HRR74_008992 [Exophiala dermatitidis]KAJ4504884.1 hypothetical protein HRR73_008638 [Exophiala dermatitidis]KAJ4530776.1 hypothetical protein HRR76_008473 [Exophiala dermatitidis]KAJ4531486.1 hypothetical protein HRR77_009469 [Exophiala dermatitidis]KAJ4556795.1 hypothetical protein HRR79_008967 [Exophiala dermatitidis]
MLTASQPVPSGLHTLSTSNMMSTRPLPPPSSIRPMSKDGVGSKQSTIWVPMLNSASKGKDVSEKQLIILGGTPERQRELLEQLNPPKLRPRHGAHDRRRQPRAGTGSGQPGGTAPISNRYALGYTYYDVLDADQEDVLARVNVYMLANPSASFAPLLKPLFTTKTVKDTLITILLDWEEPFTWARQLRQWIRLLRSVILSLDEQTKIEMEETMTAWKEKRVGPDAPAALQSTSTTNTIDPGASVPLLGPGEWDEGLGIPLSVVCTRAEKIEVLERDYGWGEDQFDFLMQWLRCVLLKHGASLVYTATYDPNNVRTLTHSSLSIHSLLKREVAKHNIVDRDKILVPPSWDSWGKIRILKDGFDPEIIANAWSVEIQEPPEQTLNLQTATSPQNNSEAESESESQSAVYTYESTLRNPAEQRPSFQPRTHDETVVVPSVQEFLQTQYEVLEKLKAEDEKEQRKSRQENPAGGGSGSSGVVVEDRVSNPTMAERIGPYQINVNGIDFDAEEAMRRLRERENMRNRIAPSMSASASSTTASSSAPGLERSASASAGVSTPMRRQGSETAAADGTPQQQNPLSQITSGKQSNEAAAQFFANLIKKTDRRGNTSASASPTRGPGTASPGPRGGHGSAAGSGTGTGGGAGAVAAQEKRHDS